MLTNSELSTLHTHATHGPSTSAYATSEHLPAANHMNGSPQAPPTEFLWLPWVTGYRLVLYACLP